MRDFKEITSFTDACKEQGIEANPEPDISKLPPGLKKFLSSAYQLAIINKSLNKDDDGKEKKADWTGNEWNHYPWWNVTGANKKNRSGSGLSLYVVDYDYSFTNVASRLTTREEEASEYSAKQFPELWKDLILDLED